MNYRLISVLSLSLLASTGVAVQSGSVSYDWCMKYHNDAVKCKKYQECRAQKRREALKITKNPQELQKGQRERFRQCLEETGLPRNPRKK